MVVDKQSAHDLIETLLPEKLDVVVPLLRVLSPTAAKHVEEVSRPEQDSPSTLEKMAASGSFQQLLQVEHDLNVAASLQELQELRERLLSCVAKLRAEIARAEKAVVSTPKPTPSSPSDSAVDATTGLPGRPAFERSVERSIEQGQSVLVALFLIERLSYVNRRFGRIAGDEIMLFVAQHLAQELPDANLLSRWSGPAFAAILTIRDTPKSVERLVRATATKQLSKIIDADGRAVMLPVSCAYMVEQLSSEVSAALVFRKLDDFVSTRSGD